jgi:hypothetical protein
MFDPPYEVVRCSWPRPVSQEDGCWTSEPEWDAPPSPHLPQPHWEMIDDRPCFLLDWRETFRRGVSHPPNSVCGDMCGFHVVFEIRIRATGALSFWDDDGSVIRRNDTVIHCDRTAHPVRRCEIPVEAGERLLIAQWQQHNDWLWGASLEPSLDRAACEQSVLRYRDAVANRLATPSGPPLKMYVQGAEPIRCVLALYSMVLNGYGPASITLFGEHQWSDDTRRFFQAALPFADFRRSEDLLRGLRAIGGHDLLKLASGHWFAMKACAALMSDPREFCLMDDDVFVLEAVDDALERFEECAAVFSPDTNHGNAYLSVWGDIFGHSQLSTGRMNTGLIWLRVEDDPATLARLMLCGRDRASVGAWAWEQGFIANCYSARKIHQLPSQRYLCPLWEGLPGGVLGYDYGNNPCGFAAVHFGGLWNKPTDAAAAWLAPQILNRLPQAPE